MTNQKLRQQCTFRAKKEAQASLVNKLQKPYGRHEIVRKATTSFKATGTQRVGSVLGMIMGK